MVDERATGRCGVAGERGEQGFRSEIPHLEREAETARRPSALTGAP